VKIAMQALTRGRFSGRFWGLVVGAGLIAPIVLTGLVLSLTVPMMVEFVAALLALAGIWWFEELWVKAGQLAPLS